MMCQVTILCFSFVQENEDLGKKIENLECDNCKLREEIKNYKNTVFRKYKLFKE